MVLRVVNGSVVEDSPPARVRFHTHNKQVDVNKWVEVSLIQFLTPNSRNTYSREATEQDKVEHADAWARFREGVEEKEPGTHPLSMLDDYKTAFELELRLIDVFTVEDLASLEAAPEEYMEDLWKQAKRLVRLVKLMEQDDE